MDVTIHIIFFCIYLINMLPLVDIFPTLGWGLGLDSSDFGNRFSVLSLPTRSEGLVASSESACTLKISELSFPIFIICRVSSSVSGSCWRNDSGLRSFPTGSFSRLSTDESADIPPSNYSIQNLKIPF